MDAGRFRQLARECGFELAGATPAEPLADAANYLDWAARGLAGEMRYLTDHRAQVRTDPRNMLPSARTVLCVGKLYNTAGPDAGDIPASSGRISRYAWGEDYHDVMRRDLTRLVELLQTECGPFEYKICVDTAPLLERSYAREAGLGWIGKNTCLINQESGSWFFLGEILVSFEMASGTPPADRCGTCTRCIDACPTGAIVESADGRHEIEAARCISYFTIELRGPIPEEMRSSMGGHVFGCDICQDVCPWNRRAPRTAEESFEPRGVDTDLAQLAALDEAEFRSEFAGSPVKRAKYAGFLRNVAVAMGNSGLAEMREPLLRLAEAENPLVSEHARWALKQLDGSDACGSRRCVH
jgi:epoxyqueuosine reductase